MNASPAPLPRRRLLQAAGALGVGAYALPAAAQTTAAPLEAYASASSVRAGERIDFHVRNPAGSLTADTTASVTFVRLAGWVDLTMGTATLPVRNRAVPADAWVAGCGWPASYSLTVPATWPSGLYYAFFLGAVGSGCCVPFVVRPAAARTPGVGVLMLVPASTAQAFNEYGGKSLNLAYADSDRAVKVSFDRPFDYRFNYAFDTRQAILARWLNRRSIKADFATCIDLQREPDLLTGYQLLVVGGEYSFWTMEQRSRFDAFVAAGGNAALLGARSCKWQSRLEPSPTTGAPNRVVVFHGSAAADPDTRPLYKTVRWDALGPRWQSAQSVGLKPVGPEWSETRARPAAPYRVQAPHWIFLGTGLKPGDTFGSDVSGPKLDSLGTAMMDVTAYYAAWSNREQCPGVPRRYLPGRSDTSFGPDMATLVASATAGDWRQYTGPETDGVTPPPGFDTSLGFVALFSRGGSAGAVFNAGTLDWVVGLQPELQGLAPSAVGRITMNVMTRLSTAAHRESAEVRRQHVVGINDTLRDRIELSIGDVRTLARRVLPDGTVRDTYGDEQPYGYLCRAYLLQVPGTVPVFRFYVEAPERNVRRRYRYSLAPAAPPGWTHDGIAFHAYATPVPNSEPVYSWYAIGDRANPADSTGWRFFYSRSTADPTEGLCDTDRMTWTFGNVAFYAPTI